jgi:YHS domain-containing protein/uncharacterized membrane protein YraQ (UPF0718 family)
VVVLDTIGRSLADAAGMFWETLWALVLGFTLSGAVQAFVSRAEMQRALGDHRPRTVAKAGFFGAISSSCSYAASALAKTLFVRGADFTAAQAFMFASTNLVVELGIVLWLLIGWQFALAEFVGGAIMIALLALVLPRVVRPREQQAARAALAGTGSGAGSDPHAGHGDPEADRTSLPWRQRIRSRAGWADAAGYTISDLTMLRKELLIGFVVAGFADAAVPVQFWKSLFLTGHGFWSVLENVVLGPFLAIISFVCSVGNVPLAAALWTGGISFGGTIAFVFADLIALPLLLIFRRYYGGRLTLKLLAVFWTTMSAAGLAVEYLFAAVRILPAPDTAEHGMVGRDVWGWNYTTVLDLVALVAFAAVYWLYRNRERFGGGAGYAKDPVCGMQVQTEHSPATATHDGTRYYFCSDHCAHRFTADPDRFTDAAAGHAGALDDAGTEQPAAVDPVCGMAVDEDTAAATADYAGRRYHFCGPVCAQRFSADPLGVLTDAPDPVCGMSVSVADAGGEAGHDGVRYVFCGPGCRDRFIADPTPFLAQSVHHG